LTFWYSGDQILAIPTAKELALFQIEFRRVILEASYPLIILAAKLGKPEPQVSGEFYEYIRSVIKPGDVIVSRENFRSTNLLIPGFWCHVSICVLVDGNPWIVEAVGKGVRKQTLAQFVLSKDHVMVIRKPDISDETKLLAAEKALEQIGKPYDYQVSIDDDRKAPPKALYCAELAWWCLQDAAREKSEAFNFELRRTMGVMTITPNDFQGATDAGKFVLVGKFVKETLIKGV
jgi:hypothetical protein